MINCKKVFRILGLCLTLTLSACSGQANQTKASSKEIILATTTSTRDSGLLDELLPAFKKATGLDCKVLALGTGAAIEAAKNSNADVLLVHDRAKEDQFVKDGYGLKRYDVMYNDFLVAAAPALQATLAPAQGDLGKILSLVKEKQLPFISRGDESGTHSFEKKAWKKAEIELPDSQPWYVSIGQGMNECLQITAEKGGVCLTDRATFLATKDKTQLEEVSKPSQDLINPYGVIELNPDKLKLKNPEGGKQFIQWLLSEEGQRLIQAFGKEKYGQALFTPGTFK